MIKKHFTTIALSVILLSYTIFVASVIWRGVHISINTKQKPLSKDEITIIYLEKVTHEYGHILHKVDQRDLCRLKSVIGDIGREWKFRYNRGNITEMDIADPFERKLFSIYLRLKEMYSHEHRNRNRLSRPQFRPKGLPIRGILQ